MVYNNLEGKPELSYNALSNAFIQMNKNNSQLVADIVHMYFVIGPKRGLLNPILALCEVMATTDFLNDKKAIEYKNPGMITRDNKLIKCTTWIEGVTLHIDRFASSICITGFPRTDTPDKNNSDFMGSQAPYYNGTTETIDIFKRVLNINTSELTVYTLTNLGLVRMMKDQGYLNDTEYWSSVLDDEVTVKSGQIRSLFQNILRLR